LISPWYFCYIFTSRYWFNSIIEEEDDCSDVFNAFALGCEAASSVVTWLRLFIFMCFFGMLVVVAGSISNDVECKRFWKPLVRKGFTAQNMFPAPDESADCLELSPINGLWLSTRLIGHSPWQWLLVCRMSQIR
jgi:hypothetical protein